MCQLVRQAAFVGIRDMAITRCVVHPATGRMRQLMDADQGWDEALYIRVQMNVLETPQ